MGNEYTPNAEQQAFLDDVASGRGSTILSSRAGTGKTATILSALSRLPRQQRGEVVLVAFSSDIAKVLKAKAPPGVEVRTMHSLGYRACLKAFGSLEVDKYRGQNIARQVSGADEDPRLTDYAWSLHRVTSHCKSVLAVEPQEIDQVIDALSPDHPEEPSEQMQCPLCKVRRPYLQGFTREGEPCGHAGCQGAMALTTYDPRPCFIEQVIECLDRATYDLYDSDIEGEPKERGYPRSVDFDDQCFLPVRMNLKLQKFAWVFCDEAQDLNAVQHRLVVGTLARGGRFFGVGDPYQAIYRFRGATSGALDKLREETSAKELKMTMTYRCGQAIVREARRYVPDFQAAPEQHEGSVEEVPVSRMLAEASAGDFILSRTNAPLLGICLDFIRERRRANIKGRDIGARLNALVRRSKATTIEELRRWVDEWASRESERLLQKGDSDSNVQDTRECLLVIVEGAKDVSSVQGTIVRMFDDDDDEGRITLSTTHRAKGMERRRVWMLRDTYRPGRSEEETNLTYVAVTRANDQLFYVRGQLGQER